MCIGNYPEILVIDPFTLETVLTLSSRVHPDWLSAIHVLRPSRRPGIFNHQNANDVTCIDVVLVEIDDVVLGLTTTGMVKVWTLSALDLTHPTGDAILEHESKQIRCLNASSMTCCLYNQRTVIIVNPKTWQVQYWKIISNNPAWILNIFYLFKILFPFSFLDIRCW